MAFDSQNVYLPVIFPLIFLFINRINNRKQLRQKCHCLLCIHSFSIPLSTPLNMHLRLVAHEIRSVSFQLSGYNRVLPLKFC